MPTGSKLFVGRKQELNFLETCYQAPRAQLVVLYGRRRLGKTECLRRFCEGKTHVWYSCTQRQDASQLVAFSQRLLDQHDVLSHVIDSFSSWEDAFADIARLDMDGRKLVVIDEFPYAAAANPALPSILQNVWDETLSREDVMIVLCGSAISFMEDLLGEKNPLYGRATGIWRMEPLPYADAVQFFPDYSAQQKLEAIGILGGVPQYLEEFDPNLSVAKNVKTAILARGRFLYNEIDFLLRQELRDPNTYNDILCSIAGGANSLNDIAQRSMADSSKTAVYLKRLQELCLVEKEFSVQESRGVRSKASRGLWKISDNFVQFWYAAVWPHISELDAGDVDGVWDRFIEPHLNDIISPAYEAVCRQWIMRRNIAQELPFYVDHLGRWWLGNVEIDIAAFGQEQEHLLGECKFSKNKVGSAVLHALRAKEAAYFPDGRGWLWLFAKEGFDDQLIGEAESDASVRLIRAEELES